MIDPASCIAKLVDSVERYLAEHSARPLATYRLQFAKDAVTFRGAAELAPYLAELGVSHVYASPYLKTKSGSPHGYAIVDYGSLNPELGNAEDFQAMVDAFHEHKLGHIIDMVPNHMCVSCDENRWWNDILENGPSSPFAAYFDVDWQPTLEALNNRILLPILGDQYGAELESGRIRAEYRNGAFYFHVYDRMLPLDPKTYTGILTHKLDELKKSLAEDAPQVRELESIATALEHLPDRTDTDPSRIAERQREKEVAKDRLCRLTESSPDIASLVANNLLELNGNVNNSRSFDSLDKLVDAQVYRLSHWKTAADEVNYRRFFDINDLAAVCMEDARVFDEGHQLVFDLLIRGRAEGLRIDHVDGLYNPTEYLWRLQWEYLRRLGQELYAKLQQAPVAEQQAAAAGAPAQPPPGESLAWCAIEPSFLENLWLRLKERHAVGYFPKFAPDLPANDQPPAVVLPAQTERRSERKIEVPWPPLYVLVEKILNPQEPLPSKWPVAGTTGYDFLNRVAALFVDTEGLRRLRIIYDRFIDGSPDFGETAYRAKLDILRSAMSSEMQLLTHRLKRTSEKHRRTRDFTFNALRTSLREILACFPIYRTYIYEGALDERDIRFVQRAVARAKMRNPAFSAAAFDFVKDVLLLQQPPDLDAAGRQERAVFVGRFQQVTSPVMAKGVEDTAFYRYFPLASLNEVGNDLETAPATVARFHEENAARQKNYPHALIATTTHDTKRSEDTRARISVLAEIPQLWRKAMYRWARFNRRYKQDVEGQTAPSRNDEYLFYQTLLGIWPLAPPDGAQLQDIVGRMLAYMEKATREAKLHTSWINPDSGYDAAVRQFVSRALENRPKNRFLADLRAFHEQIVDYGLYNALGQLALKLMSPGAPDIYQGQELWDFSLVDPDNRRLVDFARSKQALAELKEASAQGDSARLRLARQLAAGPRDGRLKMFVTWQLLQFRRNNAELFAKGDYMPLVAKGSRSEHVCAFLWRAPSAPGGHLPSVAVIIPRLTAKLLHAAADGEILHAPMGAKVWQDTLISCPASEHSSWQNVFTGAQCRLSENAWLLGDVFADFPVAVLCAGSSE